MRKITMAEGSPKNYLGFAFMMRPPRPVLLPPPPPLPLSPRRIKTQIKAKLKLPKTKVLKYPRKKGRERELEEQGEATMQTSVLARLFSGLG